MIAKASGEETCSEVVLEGLLAVALVQRMLIGHEGSLKN